MAAARYDFQIEQYTPLSKSFTYKDASGSLVILTGYTARMQVRTPTGSLIHEMTTENGGITLGGVAGTLVWRIPAVDTSKMNFTKALYDMVMVPPSGDPYRIMEGEVTLARGQTR